MNKKKIVIFDASLEKVGHGNYYNKSLKYAFNLHGCDVKLYEYYRGKKIYHHLSLFFKLIGNRKTKFIIFPTPRFFDYFFSYILSFIFFKKKFYVFIRRLEQNTLKKRIKNCFYRCIYRRENIFLLVDNSNIAQELGLVAKSFTLPIPPPSINMENFSESELIKNFLINKKISYGFLGRLNSEKGSFHIQKLIEIILKTNDSGVFVQLAADEKDANAIEIINNIVCSYKNNSRVHMHFGHLKQLEYDTVLKYCDVGVTPYNVQAYGMGSSGVAAEFIMSGKLVLSSKIKWLSEHPIFKQYCIFFDPMDVEDTAMAVSKVTKLKGLGGNRHKYSDDWLNAIKVLLDGRS